MCHSLYFENSPIQLRNACLAAARRTAACPRKPNTTRFAVLYKPLQACNPPLRSENSYFFKWLFTKWRSLWSVVENLDKSLQGSIRC